jgi:hypothetical protein
MDNLTGLATDMGVIGSGSLTVRDFTLQRTRDTSMAHTTVQGQLMAALTLNTRSLIFFDSYNPSYVRRMLHLNGMASGQAMLSIAYGMDQKLYGLGYNAGNQTYQLYTIDTLSGSVSAVNNSTGSMNLGNDNSTYGNGANTNVAFNFIGNATNRIRVIGNNGMTNVQLDATTGAIVEVDSNINYMSGDANYGQSVNIGSVGYLNSYNGSNSSDMIGYDFNTGAMVGLNTSTNGYGSLVTDLSLTGLLNIFGTGNTYHNGYLDIWYDLTNNTNIGYMASNYYGDSTATENYSTLYTMNNMTATTNPANPMAIGNGTPVKGVAAQKAAMPTSVNTIANSYNTDLFVYPNPTTNNARIVLSDPSIGKVRVDVIDLDGRIVNEYVYPSGSYNLDISMGNMPNGLYNVRVTQKGEADQNVKIIKN